DDDDDKPVDPSLQPLQDQYSQLKIRHEWVNVKMTPDRITNCLGVAGHLSFWDIDNKEEDTDEPVIFSYRPTTQNITNLKFSVNDASTLYLSSIDGSFRTFDMNAAKFNDIVLPDKYPITHFDITDNGQVIYFATGNGEIGIHDTRSKDTDTVITLRNQKIGCININPIHTNLMVAASNDRTATIWDIRNLKNKDNDDDDAGYTPLQELTHGFAVTSAFWSPDGKYLSTSCYDDFLRVFDLNKDNLQLDLKKKIRHNCHTGKTVWNENKRFGIDHPHFVIGDLRHLTSIYAAESATKIVDLYDPDRITATPAVNSVHPTLDSLAIISANGSGRAWCWT
ncbi:WD40-repeat-containing domain protein, partial [Cunninghamella echinulata]